MYFPLGFTVSFLPLLKPLGKRKTIYYSHNSYFLLFSRLISAWIFLSSILQKCKKKIEVSFWLWSGQHYRMSWGITMFSGTNVYFLIIFGLFLGYNWYYIIEFVGWKYWCSYTHNQTSKNVLISGCVKRFYGSTKLGFYSIIKGFQI